MSTTALKGTIRRKLEATDGTRKRRPFFIEIDPQGVISVWPRRCKPAQISVAGVYQHAVELEVARERRVKNAGKPVRVKRGMLR